MRSSLDATSGNTGISYAMIGATRGCGVSGFRILARDIASGTDTIVYESPHRPSTNFISISPDRRHMAVREQENDYRKEDLIVLTDLKTGERRDLLREPFGVPRLVTVEGGAQWE